LTASWRSGLRLGACADGWRCEPCVAGAQDQTVDRAAVRRLPVQLTSLQKCHFAVDSAASMRPSL
jgi:hypothetical protein